VLSSSVLIAEAERGHTFRLTTTTFDRPRKTSKNGKLYWKVLRSKYDQVDAEIRAIMGRWQGYSADYIEDQPVLFRTKLIQQIIKQDQEGKDGSGAAKKT
jgi:hypothetical protein